MPVKLSGSWEPLFPKPRSFKMNFIRNIILIRAGYLQRKKFEHPLHCPPPLSLKYAKALLETSGEYNVKIVDGLIDCVPDENILKMLSQWPAQFVFIEIASPASEKGLALSQKIRSQFQDMVVVAGGSDVSERYQFYLTAKDTFDVILRGEFENELTVLVKQLQTADKKEDVQKIYLEERNRQVLLVEDLDVLPCLAWTRAELKKYPYRYPLKYARPLLSGYVSTSRGCRHGCTFCSPSVRKSYGKKLRLRSASHVVAEIEYLQTLGVNLVSFEDDDFTGSRDHLLSICEELMKKNTNIKWTCHARIDEVSPDILKIMRQAGCILILFGVESGSQNIIHTLHKNFSERDWGDRARETFLNAREAGIATCALFMVGNPGETRDDVNASIQLAFDLHPDFIKVHNFTLYPGSKDYGRYQSQHAPVLSQHHYLQPIINVSCLTNTELKILQREFYRRFFFRASFLINHTLGYAVFYLLNWPWSFKMLGELLSFLFSRHKNESLKGNDAENRKGGL